MKALPSVRKVRIRSASVHEEPPGFWSNCYLVGNQIILAGMVAPDKRGKLVGGSDPYKQTIQAFKNMKALVEEAGGKMDDVVRIEVYLTDMRFRPAFVEARRKFFTGDFPTSAVIGNVTLASPDLLVEIT